jgi:uncharacterized membrane protein
MAENEPLSLALTAILVMAAATYLMRAGGFWLMAHVPLTARVRRMLAALPGSIIVAIVLPLIAKSGAMAAVAIAAAAAVMIVRRNEMLAIAVAVGLAALGRSAGL